MLDKDRKPNFCHGRIDFLTTTKGKEKMKYAFSKVALAIVCLHSTITIQGNTNNDYYDEGTSYSGKTTALANGWGWGLNSAEACGSGSTSDCMIVDGGGGGDVDPDDLGDDGSDGEIDGGHDGGADDDGGSSQTDEERIQQCQQAAEGLRDKCISDLTAEIDQAVVYCAAATPVIGGAVTIFNPVLGTTIQIAGTAACMAAGAGFQTLVPGECSRQITNIKNACV